MKNKILVFLALLFFTAPLFSGEALLNFNEDKSIQYNKKADGFKNVTVITGKKSAANNLAIISLADYADQDVLIEIKGEMKIVDVKNQENEINWIINDFDAKFPTVAGEKCKSGEWKKISGRKFLHLGDNRQLYISSGGISKDDLTIYLKDFSVKISGDDIGRQNQPKVSWLKAPSYKEAYKGIFDYVGFATPLQGVLDNSEVQKGLKLHATGFTCENECKPDFIFNWQKPGNFKEFQAADGKSYKVPGNTPQFNNLSRILSIAKKNGLKMRGHVLVWHNQTPDWFFREDFNTKNKYTDKDTMNARMEWYIKTVLENVTKWEKENNGGNHIIYAWDVVNEAISDGATEKNYIRKESPWYRIYQSEEFIINAFRFANKYAPKDIQLVYNDYGCYGQQKTMGIVKLVKKIQECPDARIDAVGMQTHVSMDYPALTGPYSYEYAVQKFINLGVDVHVTEMDIAKGNQMYSSEGLAEKYREYFELFIRNRKTEGKHGISSVTLWGIVDERSWIYNNGNKPLMFNGNYNCKEAFFKVLEAASDSKKN